jgi:type II secretory pathway pseudopilin PulG
MRLNVTSDEWRVTGMGLMKNRVTRHPSPVTLRAFTIIEIALCLGIIAFALVAILGVLPLGMNVQKQNRQETIIAQDASVWMDAIRSGARGYDDLTNYVINITNRWTQFDGNNAIIKGPDYDSYNFNGSQITSIAPAPVFPLTSGERIIGLLGMPQITYPQSLPAGGYQSNYVTAYIRAMSGAAVDKPPQDNASVLGDAFAYKLISEVIPYVPFDSTAIDFSQANNRTPQATNYARLLRTLGTNSHDVRLSFRWPLLPNGDVGEGWQTFRTMAGGNMTNFTDSGQQVYFVQPSVYQ